jgi:hypothetical protein
MMRDQGIDQLAKRLAFQNLRKLMERKVDPMVCDPSLRKVIRANAL